MFKLVRISWDDAKSDCCWTHPEEVKDKKVEHCTTIGWLIDETPEDYKVTSTKSTDGNIMGYTIIPKNKPVLIQGLDE